MSNDEIKDLFETLGVTRRYIGYYFLLDAVEIVNRDETTLLKVGEYIYEPIAKKYNCNTATVERNIRTVILHIWKNNKGQVEKIMGAKFATVPTVSEFIDNLAYYISKGKGKPNSLSYL